MIVFLMCLAGLFLAKTLTVVIFSVTSNETRVKEHGVVNLQWSVVWLMVFMSFFYIHSLQEELETYTTQEQINVEN